MQYIAIYTHTCRQRECGLYEVDSELDHHPESDQEPTTMIIVAVRAPTKINVATETAMVIAQIMQLPARLSECERADSKRLYHQHIPLPVILSIHPKL